MKIVSIKISLSQNNLSEVTENLFKNTKSQINLSEAREQFFNTKHTVLKDISEALEQVHSS